MMCRDRTPFPPRVETGLYSAALTCLALLPLGCHTPRSDAHAELDHAPTPAMASGVASASVASTAEDSSPKERECGPSTARWLDGVCRTLQVMDTPYGQRVEIPAGLSYIGHVPDRYDAGDSRSTPVVRWSGTPPREVGVRGFWIDVAEVTRGAYEDCVAVGACTSAVCPEGQSIESLLSQRQRDSGDEDMLAGLPQTCVTHAQAEAFCRSHGGRLPTEVEWEAAARGPEWRVYPTITIMDALIGTLRPVAATRPDRGFYGVVGQGSNAAEWVADVYDPDVGLRPFLKGEFRRDDGPLARSVGDFEESLGRPRTPPVRHVVKHARIGWRRAIREEMPPTIPEQELEGWTEVQPGPGVGFRCAMDLRPDDTRYFAPSEPKGVPTTLSVGEHEIFGGVAEAVDQAEAQTFCSQLNLPGDGAGWRLPRVDEIDALAEGFRGPGPFWASDGALAQTDTTPEAPWQAIEVESDESLAARCVRLASEAVPYQRTPTIKIVPAPLDGEPGMDEALEPAGDEAGDEGGDEVPTDAAPSEDGVPAWFSEDAMMHEEVLENVSVDTGAGTTRQIKLRLGDEVNPKDCADDMMTKLTAATGTKPKHTVSAQIEQHTLTGKGEGYSYVVMCGRDPEDRPLLFMAYMPSP